MPTAQPPDGQSEVDSAWTADDSTHWTPPEMDADRPSPARMYDYALGGKDHFEVDWAAVEAVVPQQTYPDARVVYVDNDPIVMTQNRALRSGRPAVITLQRDLREPASILDDPEVRAHLDFDRPIGLLLVAVMHFVSCDLGIEVVTQYRRGLPTGSYIGISTACTDGMKPELINRLEQVYSKSAAPVVLRTVDQVEQLFEGVDLIEPGLTDVTQWRGNERPLPVRNLFGVGKVTAVGR